MNREPPEQAKDTVAIPIAAGKEIAEAYGYDQVLILARKVGNREHVTTFGVDKVNCVVAARMGDFLKHKLMGWPRDDAAAAPERVGEIISLLRNPYGRDEELLRQARLGAAELLEQYFFVFPSAAKKS
jgi:hypothetical protein